MSIEWVRQEILALRLRFLGDEYYMSPTDKQLKYLSILVQDALDDPERRIPVLATITKLPISSSRHLTRWTVSVLIDYLKEDGENCYGLSDHGREFVRGVEGLIKEYPDAKEREAHISGVPSSVRYLQAAYTRGTRYARGDLDER